MPTSSLDGELASRFSNFFLEKITRIGSEIDAAVVNREFSVDFPLWFTRSLTSHFRLVTEAVILRYMRETRKTCSLDPINVSSLVKHMKPQLLSDFSDCGVEGIALSLLES